MSAVDMSLGIGWLDPAAAGAGGRDRPIASRTLCTLATEADYLARTPERQTLRFSSSGRPARESEPSAGAGG